MGYIYKITNAINNKVYIGKLFFQLKNVGNSIKIDMKTYQPNFITLSKNMGLKIFQLKN